MTCPFGLMPDDENVHGEDTVEFLKQLKRHIPGPMTILWDRGNVHDRSKVVRAYLAGHPRFHPKRTMAIFKGRPDVVRSGVVPCPFSATCTRAGRDGGGPTG